MGHCKDCRWWEHRQVELDPDESGHQPTIDGACRRFGLPLHGGGSYSWSYEVPQWETSKAYLSGMGDTICFMTEADFGCVQFEDREV